MIGQIINQLEIAKRRVLNLEEVVGEYIVYQKNDKKFEKHMQKKIKEYEKKRLEEKAKNGTKDSVHNDKQQVVPAP